jgi:7-keto-8-aminopelargonate synthetase-like enzyme
VHRQGRSFGGRREANPLGELVARIRGHREIRVVSEFLRRMPDLHLKDLVVEAVDDHRRMRVDGRWLYNFGSDSYLGLDRHPRVRQVLAEAAGEWGTHNGASRMFHSVALCEQAERALAEWLDVAETLIFPSVTLANIGLIPGLVGREELLVVDRKAHNSIQEAAKIAAGNGARVHELRPCTGQALQALLRRENPDGLILATDGIYSMEGTSPPLAELARVVGEHGGTCYVDDAHATAVAGPGGRGMACAALGSLRHVLAVGSLSKGFSCMGAYVTCTAELKPLLKMKANTYIFGGPVPPPYLAAVCAVCDILRSAEYGAILARLYDRVDRVVDGLRSIGYATLGDKQSPVVSVLIGDIHQTLRAGRWLFDRGLYVQSVTYPAVGFNRGLLRILVNANHTDESIHLLLAALADLRPQIQAGRVAA